MDIPTTLQNFRRPFCDAEKDVVAKYFKQCKKYFSVTPDFPYTRLDSQLLRFPKSTWKAIRDVEAVRNPKQAADWAFYRNKGFMKIWIRQERITRMIKVLIDYKNDWNERKKRLGKKYKIRVMRIENHDFIKSYNRYRRQSNGPSNIMASIIGHKCNVKIDGTCKFGKNKKKATSGKRD